MSAVVLLSGGLDSTVALAMKVAEAKTRVALALTFDYGQRAASREVASARAVSRRFGIEHRAIELPFFRAITRTALVSSQAELPHPEPPALDDERARASALAVWVPNRNGVLVAIAAAHAESIGARRVIVGFNREEGATFPDNTPEFVTLSNAALAYSTLNKVKVENPVQKLDKEEIVRRGRELGAPIPLVWSCYEGGAEQCGACESCRRLMRALERAGAAGWFAEERARLRAAEASS